MIKPYFQTYYLTSLKTHLLHFINCNDLSGIFIQFNKQSKICYTKKFKKNISVVETLSNFV